jgi:hypothetical protein
MQNRGKNATFYPCINLGGNIYFQPFLTVVGIITIAVRLSVKSVFYLIGSGVRSLDKLGTTLKILSCWRKLPGDL